MTLEELQRSDQAKQILASALSNRTISDILDVVQRMAMPSKTTIQTPLVPGLHPDTALAHMAYFHAGWAECITFIRSIPTGATIPTQEREEEPWEGSPEVQEITRQIELAKNQAPAKS